MIVPDQTMNEPSQVRACVLLLRRIIILHRRLQATLPGRNYRVDFSIKLQSAYAEMEEKYHLSRSDVYQMIQEFADCKVKVDGEIVKEVILL